MNFLLALLLVAGAFAQHSEQPQKESTDDLRNQTALFTIEDLQSEKTFRLERDSSLSYALKQSYKGEETLLKIDSREGAKLDRDFAAKFLRSLYEIPSVEGKCELTLRLNLKGESQEICKKDDKKTQELIPFVLELAKRF
jgi:hypothetical protein